MHLYFAAVCSSTSNNALINSNSLPHTCADDTTVRTIFLTAFTIIGAIAFLFIVIGGARYTFSKGEPDNVQKAKNEVKYAIIGLLIAATAAAFVNFVLDRLGK